MLKINPVTRSLFIVGAAVALTAGVTYAIVDSKVTLAASTISSTTADLKIRSTNRNWSSSAPGFHITNLIPGTGATENVYFKNAGNIGLNITAHVPKVPAVPTGGYGFSGWNNLEVDITGNSCGKAVDTTMSALLSSTPVSLPCGPLPAGATGRPHRASHVGNYSLHFDIVQSAITGSHVGVGNFDIQFTGVQG